MSDGEGVDDVAHRRRGDPRGQRADPAKVVLERSSGFIAGYQVGRPTCPVDKTETLYDVRMRQILQDLRLRREPTQKRPAVPLGIQDLDRDLRTRKAVVSANFTGAVGHACGSSREHVEDTVGAVKDIADSEQGRPALGRASTSTTEVGTALGILAERG
jgi:hypothetical protein